MKRIFLLLLCSLMISMGYAQSTLSQLEQGKSFQYPLDKHGKKYLEFYLQDIQYSDSTERSCIALYTFRVTSIGSGVAFGYLPKLPKKTIAIRSPYFMKYSGVAWSKPIEMLSTNPVVIPQDSSKLIQYKLEYIGQQVSFYVNGERVAYMNIKYDNTLVLKKQAEQKRKIWKEEQYESIKSESDVDIRAQGDCGIDTLFLYSSRVSPYDKYIRRYYIINSQKMMATCVDENLHYQDTFYFDKMPHFLLEDYHKEIAKAQKQTKLLNKDISEIDAREVFDYFPRGTDIVEFTKRMGNKELAITPCCYETTFYDKFEKKNVLFQFTFWDGRLASIKRESTNTMPTNDVWTAFMLLETVDTFRDLGKALEILKKDKQNTSTKR